MGGAGVMVGKIVVVGRGLGRLKVLAKVEGIGWGRVEIFSSSHLEDSVDTSWKERPGALACLCLDLGQLRPVTMITH